MRVTMVKSYSKAKKSGIRKIPLLNLFNSLTFWEILMKMVLKKKDETITLNTIVYSSDVN